MIFYLYILLDTTETHSELEKKHNTLKYDIGGRIKYTNDFLSTGITILNTSFNRTFTPSYSIYNIYKFKGSNNTVASVDYQYFWNQLELSGETAFTSRGWATLNHLIFQANENISLGLSYRNIQKTYFSFYKNNFGESNTTSEQGYYLGIKWIISSKLNLNFYHDIFEFNQLETYKKELKKATDFLLQVNYQPFENFENYIRFKHKYSYQIRYNALYYIYENLRLQSRVELHKKANDIGSLIFQDFTYKTEYNLTFSGRIALFDTSWDTRIYAYEKDVLYSFSIPAYYDKGVKYFLLIKYTPTSNINLWLKLSQTKFTNKREIGSGYDKIQGNVSTDLKLQLQVKF